jgi:hypothetical protein
MNEEEYGELSMSEDDLRKIRKVTRSMLYLEDLKKKELLIYFEMLESF